MEETLEKVVHQELKVKKDDSIRDNKRKNTWNLEKDRVLQKKPFKEFKKTKIPIGGTKEVRNNPYENKSGKSNEKKGPPGGCFNCGGDEYANK